MRVCCMEFLILILAVVIYQWAVIPITKKKVGFLRDDSNPLFYDYKTKWQMPFELITSIVMIVLAILLAPVLGIASVLFIPMGLIAIFIVRGKLEYKYMADYKHHVISYLHAFAIFFAFSAVFIFAIISK